MQALCRARRAWAACRPPDPPTRMRRRGGKHTASGNLPPRPHQRTRWHSQAPLAPGRSVVTRRVSRAQGRPRRVDAPCGHPDH